MLLKMESLSLSVVSALVIRSRSRSMASSANSNRMARSDGSCRVDVVIPVLSQSCSKSAYKARHIGHFGFDVG
jgi:hypothetical protein